MRSQSGHYGPSWRLIEVFSAIWSIDSIQLMWNHSESSSCRFVPRSMLKLEISETESLRMVLAIRNLNKKVYTWIVWARISNFAPIFDLDCLCSRRRWFPGAVFQRVFRIGAGREVSGSKFQILAHRIHVAMFFLSACKKNGSAGVTISDISSFNIDRWFELEFISTSTLMYCRISDRWWCLTSY